MFDAGGRRPRSPGLGAQRLDQASLCRRHQLGNRGEVAATSRGQPERRTDIDPDHMPAWRQPQLALAGEQHVPRLVLLPADQGVLVVGAAVSVDPWLASGAGQVVVAAGSAVFGPSARLKMPAAEGPHPYFAAFSSTWRSVNS